MSIESVIIDTRSIFFQEGAFQTWYLQILNKDYTKEMKPQERLLMICTKGRQQGQKAELKTQFSINEVSKNPLDKFPISFVVLDAFDSMNQLQRQTLAEPLLALLKSRASMKEHFKRQLQQQLEGIDVIRESTNGESEVGPVGFAMPSISENQIQIAKSNKSKPQHIPRTIINLISQQYLANENRQISDFSIRLLHSLHFCNNFLKEQPMSSQFVKGQLSQFYRISTISNKLRNCKLQLGLIDGQQTVMKIIQCTEEEELIHRQIISKRQATSLYIKPQSWFQNVNKVSTFLDRINNQQRRYLLIFTPYVSRTELTNYTNTALSHRIERVTPQQKAIRVAHIIIKAILILMRSSNHQIYTYDTFLLDENQSQLTINRASFVGMSLLLRDQLIEIESFKEILGILQSDTLEKRPEERLNLQLKFRGLANLLISLIIERKFSLFYGSEMWRRLQSSPSLLVYKEFLRDLKIKFESFLRIGQVSAKIASLDRSLNIRVGEFLRRLLVDEENLSWPDVFELLVPKRPRRSNFSQQPHMITQKIAEEMYGLLPFATKANQILHQLGIADPQTYLMVLLYDGGTPMSLLMTEFHLDDYFLSPRNFNPENVAIYKRLIQVVSVLLSEQQIEFCELNNMLINQKTIENCLAEIEDYEKLRSDKNRFRRLQKSQLLQFLRALTHNFAVYRTKIKEKKYIGNTQEAKSIKLYSKLFA